MRWDAILKRLPAKSIMAEIGVWKGTNANNLLSRNKTLKMFLVDRWQPYTKQESESEGVSKISLNRREKFKLVKKQTMQKMEVYGKRAKIVPLDSVSAAKTFPDNYFDFVFIDALHSYEGCKSDIEAWLSKVKIGGWISGHDYGRREGVTKAVIELFGQENIELDDDYTWFIKVK